MNGNLNGATPQPIPTFDGNTQIPITLPLATWNIVLTLIAEAPWKTADPLVKELHRQIQIVLEGSPQRQQGSLPSGLNPQE